MGPSSVYHKEVPKSIILGISGASGAPISLSLFTILASHRLKLELIFSQVGAKVFKMETGIEPKLEALIDFAQKKLSYDGLTLQAEIHQYHPDNLFAAPASGTNLWDAMVICPASAGICGRIASGSGEDLMARCADVALKERRKLIIVLRESPLSAILIENLLKLTNAGAIIIPPVLTFYHEPKTQEEQIDFWVGRIIDHLGLPSKSLKRWGEKKTKEDSP